MPELSMKQRTVVYAGARMRVRDFVTGPGRTFTMVHGIGVSSDYFEPLARALYPYGNVLLLDLPGFGGVPRPAKPLGISAFADIVYEGLREESFITDPVVIGHSMGAQVVAEALAQHDVSSHAVLIGPPVNPKEPWMGQQAFRLLQSTVYETPELRSVALKAYLRCGPTWFLEVLPSMMRFRMRERLPLIKADTLIIRGEHDYVVPEPWVQEMTELLPRGRHVTIPGASHNVVYDSWRQVADLTLEHVGIVAEPTQ